MNNTGLQEKWDALKAMVAKLQLVAPRKKAIALQHLSLESPRVLQVVHSEVSALRSSSPFESAYDNLQSDIPPNFIRRAAEVPLQIEATKRTSPQIKLSVLNSNVNVSPGSTGRLSSLMHSLPLPKSSISPPRVASRPNVSKSTGQSYDDGLA